MDRVAIASAVRTPIGRYMGSLRDVPAYDVAALVLNAAVERANVPPERADVRREAGGTICCGRRRAWASASQEQQACCIPAFVPAG